MRARRRVFARVRGVDHFAERVEFFARAAAFGFFQFFYFDKGGHSGKVSTKSVLYRQAENSVFYRDEREREDD
jgi:hypothetical protein